MNFDASSTAKIATGNFGWFRTVIDVGDIPPQNWFVETQGNDEADCVHEQVETFLESGLLLLLARSSARYVLSRFLLLPLRPMAGKAQPLSFGLLMTNRLEGP